MGVCGVLESRESGGTIAAAVNAVIVASIVGRRVGMPGARSNVRFPESPSEPHNPVSLPRSNEAGDCTGSVSSVLSRNVKSGVGVSKIREIREYKLGVDESDVGKDVGVDKSDEDKSE